LHRYAASIGGLGTIIGSPPNGILVRFIEQTYNQKISFADWLLIGGPFVLVFLPVAWLLVTQILFPVRLAEIAGGRDLIKNEYRGLGPLGLGEQITLAVFAFTVTAWIFRPLLNGLARHNFSQTDFHLP
jgi:solute carrier family 13 (sodium-dependent dicarboxylate transporter), member 2/3/5